MKKHENRNQYSIERSLHFSSYLKRRISSISLCTIIFGRESGTKLPPISDSEAISSTSGTSPVWTVIKSPISRHFCNNPTKLLNFPSIGLPLKSMPTKVSPPDLALTASPNTSEFSSTLFERSTLIINRTVMILPNNLL